MSAYIETSDLSRFDHLKIRHLKLLELLQETGSFRRAATLLCVTQPAVTTMVRDLERMFGAPLVTRSRSGAILTAAGIEVRERLRVAMNEIDAARRAAINSDKPQILRIGALPAALVELIPAAIRRLDLAGNLPRISIHEATVETLLNMLARGELDCVVARIGSGNLYDRHLYRFHHDLMGEESLHVICCINHPIAKKKKVSLKDISLLPWVLPPVGSLTRDTFDDIFIRAGLRPPSPIIESHFFYTNINIIMRTNMLAVAPTSAIEKFGHMIHVLPVRFTYTPAPIALIYRQENEHLPTVHAFRDAMRKS
ncbi:LysR family transcriptional regulator [Noviherbaspirillum aerium]|uniref:LysR family transcriptional regulator n=1 Tax=Noviherbaspirillum aerium TaxID=2588497 RepID=UPI00124EE4B3|nr:LysR family transcriptional regulator [Noviherbaspirillum aerium]